MADNSVSLSDEDTHMDSVLDPLFDPLLISDTDLAMISSLLDDEPLPLSERIPIENGTCSGSAAAVCNGKTNSISDNDDRYAQGHDMLDPISMMEAGFEWPSMDLSLGCDSLSKPKSEDSSLDMPVSPIASDEGSGRNISIEDLLSDPIEPKDPSNEKSDTQANAGVDLCEVGTSMECEGSEVISNFEIGTSEFNITDTTAMPVLTTGTHTGPEGHQVSENLKHISNLPQLPSARQRYSDGARPSKYCHVCGRCSSSVGMLACFFSQKNLCRKVVCHICVNKYDREFTLSTQQTGQPWSCTHCRGMCPKRARCVQYYRNNQKRRMRNLARKIGKESGAFPRVCFPQGEGPLPRPPGVLEKLGALHDRFSPTGIPDGVFQTT